MAISSFLEHAEDVLAQYCAWDALGGAALIVVTHTEGGAVRAPGALMTVSHQGDCAGYVSGGCVDADVVLHAEAALADGKTRQLRYGLGSPFKDLPLPCGGAIELAVLPAPDHSAITACLDDLKARRRATLSLETSKGTVTAHYQPKLRLRIAGRGADALALAKLAQASGIATCLALRDGDDVALAKAAGLPDVVALQTPSALPDWPDDAWTAFALMFHDKDWETDLLRQALAGPAFYVGAVGSKRTHAARLAELEKAGVAKAQRDRIRGPIGLVPSMRDASMLAVSALAEIVQAYHDRDAHPFARTGLVLLAAGRASRFEAGDKLMAMYRGRPVLAHTSGHLSTEKVGARIGVVGPTHIARSDRLQTDGWQAVENPLWRDGQGTSLACGIQAVDAIDGIDAALVLLGDMPNVPAAHLHGLRAALEPDVQAVMTRVDGVLGPPALFHRDVFPALMALKDDRGARAVFDTLENTRLVDLDARDARDIDCLADLQDLEGLADA